MASQTVLAKKKRGPAPTGKGQQIVVRMHDPQLAALDAFVAAQPEPRPSRPEAIRYLLQDSLTGLGYLPHREDPEGAN